MRDPKQRPANMPAPKTRKMEAESLQFTDHNQSANDNHQNPSSIQSNNQSIASGVPEIKTPSARLTPTSNNSSSHNSDGLNSDSSSSTTPNIPPAKPFDRDFYDKAMKLRHHDININKLTKDKLDIKYYKLQAGEEIKDTTRDIGRASDIESTIDSAKDSKQQPPVIDNKISYDEKTRPESTFNDVQRRSSIPQRPIHTGEDRHSMFLPTDQIDYDDQAQIAPKPEIRNNIIIPPLDLTAHNLLMREHEAASSSTTTTNRSAS
jgi:hypothetical protein